jgi:hypothetical protein
MFEILRKHTTTRLEGGGCVEVLLFLVVMVVVVVDICVPVGQLHDKIWCSTCKDIAFVLVLPLAGRQGFIILFGSYPDSYILFQHVSLLITFFRVYC